jgi:hypothetical protein
MHVHRGSLVATFAALLGAASLVLAGAATSAGVLPSLYVNYVGNNCTFTITSDGGANIGTIAPGTYQVWFSQDDFVSCVGLPDFVLTGPGVSVETPIDAGTGAAAEANVTFQPGSTYVALDRSQPVLSKVTFSTTSTGTAGLVNGPASSGKTGAVDNTANGTPVGSATQKTSTPAARRGTLVGRVSSSGKVTLTYQGRVVSSLKAGLYTVSVTDGSKKSGFVIRESNKAATSVSTAPFTGQKSKMLDLSKGQWFFYPSFIGQKTYFLVVAS